ncbi:MAG TPA: porin family protein [Gemmatimonadales bacterium]
MRKTLLLVGGLAFAAALSSEAGAQTFGVKGGLSFPTLSDNGQLPVFKRQTRFAVGVHMVLPSDPGSMLMFQPELLYSRQGALASNQVGETEFDLSYVRLTPNLRLTVPLGGVQPYFLGGPYAAWRASCEMAPVSNCNEISRTDWGLDLGAGIRFGGKTGFFVEGRYAFGLQDITDRDAGFNSKNRVALALVGVSF